MYHSSFMGYMFTCFSNMLELFFQKYKMMVRIQLEMGGKLPKKMTEKSTGFDVFTVEGGRVETGNVAKIELGFKMEMPDGCFAMLLGRSSMALKSLIIHSGVIDSDFREELCLILYNGSGTPYCYEKHQRMGQLLFIKNSDVSLMEGKVGENSCHKGFGSTGK